VAVPVSGATAFDPPPGDGGENSATIGNAVDRNPDTAWTTERYDSAALGGLKQGVGIVVELGRDATVAQIRVISPRGGWTFRVCDAGDSACVLDPASARPNTAGQVTFEAVEGTTVLKMRPFPTRSILIWITGLVPDGNGYRAAISEISVLEAG
jgi:hypothetical protein